MTENPFDEPGDQDRTVIRPRPAGVRPIAAVSAALSVVGAAPAGPDIEAFAAGDGPLAVAAAPLLHLLARLRNAASAPDPGDMRERTWRELRAFERRAKDHGVPADQLRQAHYALCAALDDAVINTPWGSEGRWKHEPLALSLHDDPDAGRGFFDQLRALRDGLPATRPVIELMFVCLALGMAGPYRLAPDGPAQIERIRHHVAELVAGAAPPIQPALSPDAAGTFVPPPPSGGIPIWVAASVALAVVAGAYLWALAGLNTASDAVYQAALAAPPSAMPLLVRPAATPEPEPPPPPPAGPSERLRSALADVPDLVVIASPTATILRLPARALFPQSTATLAASPALDRVADALKDLGGPVRILAYTDTLPARGVGFPSNLALSAARAKAVRAALARVIPDPARLTADGRAEADPVVPNTTPEGRDRNRRIDIVVPVQP